MVTLSNSNYNGEALDDLYLTLTVGNEVMEKGAAKLHTGVAKKKSLPKLSQTANPIGDYVDGAPTTNTAVTSYAERELDPQPMTVYEEFKPADFLDIWPEWQSQGDNTNLELNQKLLNAILELYKDGIGVQTSKLFWQGDTNLGAGNPLNKFDGIITRAKADPNVIKPTPQGEITPTNFMDILAAVRNAIPDHFEDDIDYVINLNTTDFKLMQSANTDLKKAFAGVFGQSIDGMYQEKKIRHFQGLPRHHILCAKVSNDTKSNLNMGAWVDPENENVLIDRVANNSNLWFLRIDYRLDANYRNASDIVLYEPA